MSVGSELVRFGRELVGRTPSKEIARWGDPTFQAWADAFLSYQGQIYQPAYTTSYSGEKVERPEDTFLGYVHGAYRSNGVIFAVSMARARPFSEIAFKYRRRKDTGGGPNLFGNATLNILDTPWPGGTTQSLMMRAEQDVTAAGTFFVAREDGVRPEDDRLRRLRPDWTEFILTAPPDQAVASDIVGIKYTPGGWWSGNTPRLYTLRDAAFWAPIPDPDSQYRGMSWLTPVIEEMQSDKAATRHKLKFFENAATPNLSVSLKDSIGPEKFKEFVQLMKEQTMGVEQAYKTLYTGGGADVRVVGADMKQLDFAITQGHGETRVSAAGGVPPIIVGLSEGLQAATYSNYGQAKRAYADLFLRSQWRSFCGAMAPIVEVPPDATLWYDSKDVAFLREDATDIAARQATEMGTINTGISAGFEPDTVVQALMADDWSKLTHTGRVSVQLQDPNAQPTADPNALPEPGAGEIGATPDPAADAGLASALDQIGS